jgi:hypothetical protein
MVSFRSIATSPALIPPLIVALLLLPVLAGFEPVGGDPDLMYRPIKTELARGLRAGQLPYWSDHFGIGTPLIAESHVAAFYPPNWVFYRFFRTATAYRLSLWVHFVALAAATYAYARVLGFSTSASALSALSFSLCGFQAVHTVHEPFYTLMPYVPLCLLLAHQYAATGRLAWLAALALAWGTQLTAGHFQIQMWTAGLVLVTGSWKVLAEHLPRSRWVGLAAALVWGACVAWVQLRLTWELTWVARFDRPIQYLANYSFPISHWPAWALPELYLGRQTPKSDHYWSDLGTNPGEATAYVGVVPLILACVGLLAARRDRPLTPWRWLAPLAFTLAVLPRWWPEGFLLLAQVPGFGWFRAPARYTLLSSLALALLAGRGLDRSIAGSRFRAGLVLALGLGLASLLWSLSLARNPAFQSSQGAATLSLRFATCGLAWVLGLGTMITWRLGQMGAWGPLAVATAELCGLFFAGPVAWGWAVQLPAESPVLERLLAEPDVGLVAGRLENLPVWAGLTAASPTFGIPAPPPNYLLQTASTTPGEASPGEVRWLRRLGVSHGIWTDDDQVRGTEVIAELDDPALSRLLGSSTQTKHQSRWKLVRYPDPFPPAWVAVRSREAAGWGALYAALARDDLADEAWFLPGEGPSVAIDNRALAHVAAVRKWDGSTAIIDHDGTCYLIVRRTYYPGWFYRLDDGPEQPVVKVSGGLQGAALTGTGTSRVTFQYHPTGLRPALVLSAGSAAAALICLFAGMAGKRIRAGSRPTASKMIG